MDAVFLAVGGRCVKGLPFHRYSFAESKELSYSKQSLSVQGIFSFTPIETVEDSGTVIVPKSHHWVQKEWGRAVPQKHQDRCRMRSIMPHVPQNHLLLFNSRTIHGSSPQRYDRSGGLNRLAVPVQFMPKAWRSQSTLKRKQQAYLRQEGSFAKPNDLFTVARPHLLD